jgi:organic hydroperoxide reductase OsmC/OhrA
MAGSPGFFCAAGLFAVLAAACFITTESQAAQSCAEQVERTKRRTGDVNAPMPHMGIAAKHVAAAEAALQGGDEAKCLEELQKTEMWLRMNRPRGGDK